MRPENCQKDGVMIDINMGCPVPKIVKNGEGSALLKDPDLIYHVVSAAVKNSDLPVTAKIRIGWDEKSINAVETAHAVEAAEQLHSCPRPYQRTVLQRKS